jgi:hypothetical protein
LQTAAERRRGVGNRSQRRETGTKRWAVYCRISKHRQHIENQEGELKEFIAKERIDVVPGGWYMDG